MSRALLALALALLTALLATSASAELTQKGDLFVRFDGGISPKELPRHTLAPIGVGIEGRIKVPSGQEPPSLRQMRIALHRGGVLNSHGLPLCLRSQIESATTDEALATCADALVGTGGTTARTSFPDQPPYLLRGEILLFNSRSHGHPSILAHVFQRQPVPITRFIVFEIRRAGGTFGTVISGEVPPEVNHNGYLKSIFLQLQRNYVSHGQIRSYLSASCPTPPGVKVASFPFARASMTFDDGRTLSSTLIRSCRAKD
jgi:hypothetical protein